MKIKLKRNLCLLFLGFLSFAVLGQAYEAALDALLQEQQDSLGPGKVVLVAKDGKVIYKKAFGKANLELDVDMDTEHVFRLGSITKQFTAAAILKLAEEGKLSLEDDITKFIKDYPVDGHTITLEHLLAHTSGIRNYTNLPKFTAEVRKKDYSPKELINFFKDEPMDFSPGEKHAYSNSGYILLGSVIEIVSGKTYEEYIDAAFFRPLGMKNSFYDRSSILIPKRIPGYQKKGNAYENSDYLSMTLPYAAGSLVSTVEDLFIWNEAVMSDFVLSMKSREKAHSAQVLNNGKIIDYGLGWRLGNVQGSPSIKHGGLVNGFTSNALYLPEGKIFVTVLSNCDCTRSLDVLASKMAAIVLGKPFQWKEIELSSKQLEPYKGVYESEYEGQKMISLQDGDLMYFNRGGSKSKIYPLGKDQFRLGNSLTVLEFKRNSNKNKASFELNGLGLPVTYNRKSTETIPTLKTIQIPSDVLDRYTGEYRFPSKFVFTVVREGNKIYGQVGRDKKEIVPYDKNKFFAKEIDARIIFSVDTDGKVIGLTKIQNDKMYAEKIK
jgi:CubicO group peptidase (beta-lactamase class C family)